MIRNMKVTALVPIKEHSERVKNKNFRDFCGKPLYHHIIESLQNTYAVDQIIIDTDSPLILKEAPQLFHKVKVIERPMELRGDFISTNKVFAYDLTLCDSDLYVQTHATNPLLRSETIAKALKCLVEQENGFDSLFSVTRYQSRFYAKDGAPINHDPENLIRTQDLSPLFEENSVLYVFTKDSFSKQSRRIGEKPMMFETPQIESIDIDDEFSFKLAELLALYAQVKE
jgi:N-acylneuraminate cytidylyltransferase